ncbi:aromatic-ring hydroxylase C-terminal domain-containing protein [Mycobacteroides stephanolepidis]|uniref:aromatic-ring hydroxylase C-terminal domain-containing protein n=1 Tax=[Mycobacterium] stephanolepidis TaxID=1520670 RepID=UPI0038CDA703
MSTPHSSHSPPPWSASENYPHETRSYARRFVLVRPDGHVAWRGERPPVNPEELVERVRGAYSR